MCYKQQTHKDEDKKDLKFLININDTGFIKCVLRCFTDMSIYVLT